jgi:hypothetical protein
MCNLVTEQGSLLAPFLDLVFLRRLNRHQCIFILTVKRIRNQRPRHRRWDREFGQKLRALCLASRTNLYPPQSQTQRRIPGQLKQAEQ